ncbi:hypothetical protein O3M35_002799 [Rhynocoris fuscipes]|uniref:Ninjurin-2 n=1 Tax=Rhynocoris fuscipes TaxID=488301 RepID=A0AAW1CQ38_9HEMI
MLDIALLTANASQLKYILQVGDKHEFYSLMLGLITTSIILQVGMGVLFLSLNLMRDCRLHLIEYKTSALVINHLALAGSFIVTALNLMISAFDPNLGRMVPANMCVGILFLIIGGLDINHVGDHLPATILNDIILIMIFVISIVNVVISGFGMEHSSQPLQIVDS